MREELSPPQSLDPEEDFVLGQLEGPVSRLPLQDILDFPAFAPEVSTMSVTGTTVLELMAQRGGIRVADVSDIESKDNGDDEPTQVAVGSKITGTKKDPDWEEVYNID